MGVSTNLISTPDLSSFNTNISDGYPIQNFDEHFDGTTSPLQQVMLFGLLVDQKDLISPDDASDQLYRIGISSQDRISEILSFMKCLAGDDDAKVKFFKDHWPSTDDTYEFGGTILYELEGLESAEKFRSYLDPNERAWLSSLDDRFTVYRGSNESRIDGISWTTDRSVADERRVAIHMVCRVMAFNCPRPIEVVRQNQRTLFVDGKYLVVM